MTTSVEYSGSESTRIKLKARFEGGSEGGTGRSRARIWGHMVSAEREPVTEVLGQSPSWIRVRGRP